MTAIKAVFIVQLNLSMSVKKQRRDWLIEYVIYPSVQSKITVSLGVKGTNLGRFNVPYDAKNVI